MPTPLIDTVRLRVAVNHQQWLERQIADYRAGNRNAVNQALSSNFRRLSVNGAYGSKASITSARNATVLFIECSLPRFLTGQNVFGSLQILPQVRKVVTAVLHELDIVPSAAETHAINEGRIGLNRVDITVHARLDSHRRVRRAIQALKALLAFTKADFSCYRDETVYVGQHSAHKTLKLYDKEQQLKAKPPSDDHPQRQRILDTASGLLRIELTLHSKVLKSRGWHEVRLFDGVAARGLLVSEIERLDELSAGVEVKYFEPDPKLSSLRKALLAAHQQGIDARDLLMTDRSFKDHRRAIKATTGIDLSIPADVTTRVQTIGVQTLRANLVRRDSETERGLRLALDT